MKPTFDYSSVFKIGSHGLVSLVLSGFISSVAAAPASNALPTGGNVVSGNVNIATNAATMNINQASSKSVINWNTYNIGSAATVNYNFAQAGSSSLNRVVSNNPSEIYGRLNANGQVILVNPNGIVFGSGSSINVGSLVATTMNVKDSDYLNGKLVFARDGSIGKILNEGAITAEEKGYISLLAPEVVNKGVIKAVMGTVSMAAGEKIELVLDDSGLKTVILEPSTVKTLIDNKALIEAKGGIVYLGAKEAGTILDGVMNLKNSGIVEAAAMNSVGGRIILDGDNIEVDGTLKAADIYAGNKNNAKTVVKATAILEGEFVETSGKVLAVENGAKIKAKSWLLDPDNVIVGAPFDGYDYGDAESVATSTIVSSLNSGANVSIEATNNVFVTESIVTGNMDGDATLTFKAGQDIAVSAFQQAPVDIDATQNGNAKKLNVYFSLGNTTGGMFQMYGGSIKTNGGDLIVGGALGGDGKPAVSGAPYASSVYFYQSAVDTGVGDIVLANKGPSGSITANLSTFKGRNITFDGYGASDVNIEGSSLEATGNIFIRGENVYFTGADIYDTEWNWLGYAYSKLKGDEITIASHAALEDADTMEIYDTFITANSKVTINAAKDVDLDGAVINFINNNGTLEINTYAGSTQSQAEAYLINDWGAEDVNELLEWINDDYGTNYATINEYFADNSVYKPAFVNLKNGTYKTKNFSDGSQTTFTPSTLAILNNQLLAFGNGLENSVNEFGMLKQPFYYDQAAGVWYKLTYSNYPLAAIIGVGGDGASEWNLNGTIVSTIEDGSRAFSNAAFNTSGLANGYGTIIATNTVTVDGKTLEMTNTYTLPSDKALIAMDTKLKNTSGSAMDNVRLWVGAQDDWIAMSDETTKERGNLINGVFAPIADSADRAKALMITGSTSGVLFRTTSEKSNVFSKEEYGSDFYTQDPAMSPVLIEESDGAYGVFTRFANLSNGASETVKWYYGAGSLANLADLATVVSQQPSGSSASNTASTPSVQTQTTNSPVEVVVSQIADNVAKNVEKTIVAPQVNTPTVVAATSQAAVPASVVQVVQPTASGTTSAQGGAIVNSGGATQLSVAMVSDANPFSPNDNISVIGGGVRLASAELPGETKSDVRPAGIIGNTPAAMVVVKQLAPQKGVELAVVAPSSNISESKVVAKITADTGSGFSFTVKEAVSVNVAAKDIKEVKATLDNGQALPAWLQFDAQTQTFKAVNPPANALPISTKVSITTKAGQTQQVAVDIAK